MTLLATLASSVAAAAETINKESVKDVQIYDNENTEQENSIDEAKKSESTPLQSNVEAIQEATSESIYSEIVGKQTEEKKKEESSSIIEDSSSADSSESKEAKQKATGEKTTIVEEKPMTKSSVETLEADGNDVVTKSDHVHYDAAVTTSDQPVFSEPSYTARAKEIGETTIYRNHSVMMFTQFLDILKVMK